MRRAIRWRRWRSIRPGRSASRCDASWCGRGGGWRGGCKGLAHAMQQVVDLGFQKQLGIEVAMGQAAAQRMLPDHQKHHRDRKSTRLNSSHSQISYAVFCLKKKKKKRNKQQHQPREENERTTTININCNT